ncbi:MAG: hypothetical protein R3220_01315 [Balneolaceae bacterium]|nr:hypothetical protein [Balneolaceae bacterium]
MEDINHHISIISDQVLRADSLSKAIEDGLKQNIRIAVLGTDNFQELKNLPKPLLLLIDLMGTAKNSRQIIGAIREMDANIKIIALHLYRSLFLVDPLYKMGINGYVYYEPSREELIKAIRVVQSGKKYVPNYLMTA